MIESPASFGVPAAAQSDESVAAVVHARGGKCVVATTAIATGQTILAVHGVLVDRPSRHTIQVDDGKHIDCPDAGLADMPHEACTWRFLNHSCDPNANLDGLILRALRPIQPGQEITFDYNTTEYDMATPFTCHCGKCGGSMIRGFKFLTPEQRRELYPRLSPYLRRKVDAPPAW